MQGNVEIILPKKMETAICCTQIGTMEQGEFVLEFPYSKSGVNLNVLRTAGQLQEAAERLKPYATEGFLVQTDEEGTAMIENLDEGVYLLDGETMMPTILFLPFWDEVETQMLYDITVVPKYGESNPQTGDETEYGGWVAAVLISVLILVCGLKKIVKKEECF